MSGGVMSVQYAAHSSHSCVIAHVLKVKKPESGDVDLG